MVRLVRPIRRLFRRFLPARPRPDPPPERLGAGVEPEVDYLMFAKWFIDEHGAGARAQAVRLTQEAMEEDDALATADWRAVEQAIALLANDSAATTH